MVDDATLSSGFGIWRPSLCLELWKGSSWPCGMRLNLGQYWTRDLSGNRVGLIGRRSCHHSIFPPIQFQLQHRPRTTSQARPSAEKDCPEHESGSHSLVLRTLLDQTCQPCKLWIPFSYRRSNQKRGDGQYPEPGHFIRDSDDQVLLDRQAQGIYISDTVP